MTQALPFLTASLRESIERVEAVIYENLKTENLFVQQMVDYLVQSQGKRLRPLLAILCAGVGGKPSQKAVDLGAAVEMLHLATLVHDDIIDHSSVRRKQKTLNFKWGNETSVLMGDYVFAASFRCMTRSLPKDVLEDLAQTTRVICRGEISETFHRFNVDLTEREYLEVVRDKTASLIAASCRLGARLGGADRRLENILSAYGENLGVAFQIIDDHLDYIGRKTRVGKPVLSDIREGKLTLPVIHLRENLPKTEKAKLRKILLKKNKSDADMQWLLRELEKTASLEYSFQRAQSFVQEAYAQLDRLNGHRSRADLEKIADFLLKRDH